jgi:L-fuconolactonase
MTFIDAHVHFWDPAIQPYAWLSGVPPIADRHAPDTLHAEVGSRMPEKIVFVECGAPWREEVAWVEALAAAEPRIAAIVARLAVDAGEQTAADLAELVRHPRVHGVRHIFQDEGPDFCVRPAFVAGVRSVAAANMTFDLCCRHWQLPAVIDLVARCPEVRFILDHAGKPDIRAGQLDPWREHIRALAARPNLVCKLSGLVTEADPIHWTTAQLEPFVGHLLDAFGPARLLFGGDWPVAKLACGYNRWLDAAQTLIGHLSAVERLAIMHDNAARIYRI